MSKGYSDSYISHAKERARNGEILLYGDFGDDMLYLATECIYIASKSLLPQKKQWCKMIIDSNGGSVSCIMGIRFAMYESGLKFHGIVKSRAYSAAFETLQYCHWRSAISNSRLLMHYGNIGLRGTNLTSIMEGHNFTADYLRLLIETPLNDIAKRTGLTIEKLHELSRFERFLTAEESLELNLIDEIISFVPTSEKPE